MLQQISTKFTGGTVEVSIYDSSENELFPGSIGIHEIKNENWEFLKFIRK